MPLTAAGFRIPAGAADYAYDQSFPNDAGRPMRIRGSMPDMHTHGRRIRLSVEPDDICVVDVPQWNFTGNSSTSSLRGSASARTTPSS